MSQVLIEMLCVFVFNPNGAILSQPRATPWVREFPEEFSPEGAALLIGTE
jgi:hypothetical protein